MEDRRYNLDQPQNEKDYQCFVMLRKDKKRICRVKCSKPSSIAIPQIWDIAKYIKKDDLPSGLHSIHIHPAHEDAHQKTEWLLFLYFLKRHEKAAVANTDNCQWYIIPSSGDEDNSHAVVMYSMLEHAVPIRQNNAKSGPTDCNYERTIGNEQARQSGVKTYSKYGCNAMVHSSYLKTLGQTHSEWIFGAVAEFVDNSRDAKATKLEISIDNIYWRIADKEIPMLAIVDDGHGMSHEEILAMVSIGRKQPETSDSNRIGRYGVGFKSGAMRLGKDALVLTQTTNSRSTAFLSQSLNEGKDIVEIPIVSYYRKGQFMELDTNVQPEALSVNNLQAIKEFSPFNEYFIGEKAGLFHRNGTGTQVYIWNLDEWGSVYSLECWDAMSETSGDIFICSRRARSRLGQMTREVPLDYSLRSYLEVIFLDPRMKIYVQGSLVKTRPLARFLHKTSIENGLVSGKPVQLVLGQSQLDMEQGNCGIFLYWHGRLIEAYKRVGSMIHNGEKSHGIIGVIDVTDVMDEGSGRVWVHNNKQRFVDCEPYALLEHWLSKKADEYLDQNIDKVHVEKRGPKHKPDHEWVQCDKCRKWRILDSDFDSKTLPQEWFCYMKPFNGKCEMLEQNPKHGVITISSQRSGYNFKTLSERNNELEQSQTQGGYQLSMSKSKHVSTTDTLPLKRRRGRQRKDSAKN